MVGGSAAAEPSSSHKAREGEKGTVKASGAAPLNIHIL